MSLSVHQRVVLQKQAQVFATKLLAKQFVIAARHIVVAEDPAQTVSPDTTKQAKDLATEKKFFNDKTKFAPQEDAAKLSNQLNEGKGDLKHAFDWLAAYFKQLSPVLEGFTKRMIKFDVGGLNQSQVQQFAGVVKAVLRLAEVLDAAGATASDIIEFVKQMDATLKTMPSQDRKKSGLRNLFGK